MGNQHEAEERKSVLSSPVMTPVELSLENLAIKVSPSSNSKKPNCQFYFSINTSLKRFMQDKWYRWV